MNRNPPLVRLLQSRGPVGAIRLRPDEDVFVAHGHWRDRPSQSIWFRAHETAFLVVALRTVADEYFAFEDSRQFGTAYSVAETAERIEPLPLKRARRLRVVIKTNTYHRSFDFDLDLNGDHMSCQLLTS